MLIGFVTKTNSISGKEVVMGVTNRTNAEFWLVVIPEAMIDGEWKPMVSQKTPAGSGLPTGTLSGVVRANTNQQIVIPCPPEAIRLRANLTFLHRPIRLESLLRKCFRAAGLKYPKSRNLSWSVYVDL